MKAVFLFNRTMVMPQPWLDAGYEVYLFDGQFEQGVTTEGRVHKVGMWFDAARVNDHVEEIAAIVGEGVRFVCSFAECTFLTVTGARWLYHPDDKHLPVAERRRHPSYPNRMNDMADAVVLARMVEDVAKKLGTDCWMLENPALSFLIKRWRPADHRFHPYEYGGYLPEDDVHPEYPHNYPPRDAYPKTTGIWCGEGFVMPYKIPVVPVPGHFHQVTKGGGGTVKTKNMRSYTPRGFALATFGANRR